MPAGRMASLFRSSSEAPSNERRTEASPSVTSIRPSDLPRVVTLQTSMPALLAIRCRAFEGSAASASQEPRRGHAGSPAAKVPSPICRRPYMTLDAKDLPALLGPMNTQTLLLAIEPSTIGPTLLRRIFDQFMPSGVGNRPRYNHMAACAIGRLGGKVRPTASLSREPACRAREAPAPPSSAAAGFLP